MRVSRSGGVRSAMRPHSNRERRRSSRVVIAFGGPLALGDELDVVDEQHVDAAVAVSEVLHALLADGVDEVVRELLAGGIQDPLARELRGHRVADGVHQVRLAQSHPAVEEERVVGMPRPLRHGEGGGVRQPVGGANDEVRELVAAVEVDGVPAGRCRGRRQAVLVRLLRRGPGRIGHHELDLDRPAHHPGQGLAHQGAVAVVQPVAGEGVGCGDAEAMFVNLDERGVLEPGLEVGGGEADLQLAEDGTPNLLRIHQ